MYITLYKHVAYLYSNNCFLAQQTAFLDDYRKTAFATCEYFAKNPFSNTARKIKYLMSIKTKKRCWILQQRSHSEWMDKTWECAIKNVRVSLLPQLSTKMIFHLLKRRKIKKSLCLVERNCIFKIMYCLTWLPKYFMEQWHIQSVKTNCFLSLKQIQVNCFLIVKKVYQGITKTNENNTE